MATIRRIVFAKGQIYHIFNRSVAKQPIFTCNKEYFRALKTFEYYQFSGQDMRFSRFIEQSIQERNNLINQFRLEQNKLVAVIAWCLMPNHFHLILKELMEDGIAQFVSKFCNSYAKYFNIKYQRNGSLFQRPFKSVHVESTEQLLHLSRYIHLNPVKSFLIKENNMENYAWSSFHEYINPSRTSIIEPEVVLENFSSREQYKKFVLDYAPTAKELEKVEHLFLDV